MTNAETDAFSYCLREIAAGDEDLTLSLRYAEAADRPRLTALFAFQVELRRIPFAVSAPPPGEIRLQWWREALDENVRGGPARAHPVIAALRATAAIDNQNRDTAERLIDARARLLYVPDFSSLEDFRAFIREAEAPLAVLAAADMPAAARDAVAALGEAYALARFAPLLAREHAQAASGESRKLYGRYAPELMGIAPSLAGRVAFLALGRGYAVRKDDRPWPVAKRLMMVRAILAGRY